MTTPAQHAAALAAAFAAFAADQDQAALTTALTAALGAYDDVGGLSDAIKTLIATNETFLASVRFFQPSGTVESVDTLPVGRPTGEYWVVTDGANAGHGYLRVGTQWVDMGLVRGPTGATPNLQVGSIAALEPDAAPWAGISGTAEDPLLHLQIPRGRNALHGISLSVAYRMEAGEVLASYVSVQDERFDPDGARAISQDADAVERVITLKRGDGSTWGTITFAAGAKTGVFDIPDPTNPADGVLLFLAPAGAGCALTHIAIHIPGAAS